MVVIPKFLLCLTRPNSRSYIAAFIRSFTYSFHGRATSPNRTNGSTNTHYIWLVVPRWCMYANRWRYDTQSKWVLVLWLKHKKKTRRWRVSCLSFPMFQHFECGVWHNEGSTPFYEANSLQWITFMLKEHYATGGHEGKQGFSGMYVFQISEYHSKICVLSMNLVPDVN